MADLSWVAKAENARVSVAVNLKIYSLEALFRTCYLFTDRCYLFLSEVCDFEVKVHFAPIEKDANLTQIIGEFCNELINQKLVTMIAKETETVRKLIVAQAFAEADLIDKPTKEDPSGTDVG